MPGPVRVFAHLGATRGTLFGLLVSNGAFAPPGPTCEALSTPIRAVKLYHVALSRHTGGTRGNGARKNSGWRAFCAMRPSDALSQMAYRGTLAPQTQATGLLILAPAVSTSSQSALLHHFVTGFSAGG